MYRYSSGHGTIPSDLELLNLLRCDALPTAEAPARRGRWRKKTRELGSRFYVVLTRLGGLQVMVLVCLRKTVTIPFAVTIAITAIHLIGLGY